MLKPYREALDLLSEMSQILSEIGLETDDLLRHSTLVKAFDRFQIEVWRVLLRLSAQLHDTSGHTAMDTTFFDRENASKHYCRQTNLARRNAGEIASLAADKGYDWQRLRKRLREDDVRPLIKHREFRPVDSRVMRSIDGFLYSQRALSETVFSTIKRTLGHAVRARAWYREFRKIVLMSAVYNIERAVKQ